MQQGILQCRCEWEAIGHVCSQSVLEDMVKPLHTTVGLRVLQGGPDVIDSPPLRKGGKIRGDELGSIVGSDGVRHAPAGEEGGEKVHDHLGCYRPNRMHVRPFEVEVIGHQKVPLVLGNAMGFPTDVHLDVGQSSRLWEGL